ncbi:MAG: CopG family antitoxin [Patescibacteria group bacterium]|nr:hypothetical protein [Patescibacteria group bacterium]
MKYYELDKEELDVLSDYASGELTSVKDLNKEKALYKKFAKNVLEKTKNINIRISEKVLQKLKSKAARQGIPYQTLASSVLHQFSAK